MTKKARKLLKEIEFIDFEINSYIQEVYQLKSLFLSGPKLKEINVQENSAYSIEDDYIKIVECNEKINQLIDNLVNKKVYISSLIEKIDDPEARLIIRYKYINLKTWEQIADELPMSKRSILYAHGRGLQQLEKLL